MIKLINWLNTLTNSTEKLLHILKKKTERRKGKERKGKGKGKGKRKGTGEIDEFEEKKNVITGVVILNPGGSGKPLINQ